MRVLEIMPIYVVKFYVPVDFVVLEMKTNVEVILIVRRPFLAITKATINIKNKKLTFEIGDEKVEFNMFLLTKQPSILIVCCRVDTLNGCMKEVFKNNIQRTLSQYALYKKLQ